MHLIAETLMFGLGLFLVLKLVNTLLAERKAQAQLAIAHEQFGSILSKLKISQQRKSVIVLPAIFMIP